MGRRRYLPEIKSEYDVLRAEAERAAINFPVQASAAEIAKIALNSINVMIGMLGLENKAFVVLHVHDEYVVECDSQVVDDIKYIVEDSMRGAGNIIGLSVPLKAKASVGDSWAEIKG
jgi:DNA polymerase-1